MTKSMKSLMMGAALAGFMAGNTMVAQNTSSTNSVFFRQQRPDFRQILSREARLQGAEFL